MTGERPFRFGVLWTSAISSAQEWKDVVRRVEDLGYDSFLVTDHLDGPDLAPISALSTAAQVTTELTLGCHVFNNDLRHPAVLARELASLDILSEGRLEIGMGAGWKQQDYAFRGVQPDSPSTRVERLGEAVRAVKSLLSGETVTIVGDYYVLHEFALVPGPVQRPRPPLMIGGGSRKILELAASEADIVSINVSLKHGSWADALQVTTRETTAQKVGWVRDAAGHRFGDVELSLVVYLIDIRAGHTDAHGSPSSGLGTSPHVLFGSLDEVEAKLERLRKELGVSYICIPDRALSSFAPVVDRLRGR